MPQPVVIDVETTGFGRKDRIVEIAAITLDPATWETVDEFDTLVNPERDVGPTGVHGISASMVESAPTFTEIIAAIAGRLQDSLLIAHNLAFDARMLRYEFDRTGIEIDPGDGLCTYLTTRQKLVLACEERRIPLVQQHRALADARATAELARQLGFSDQVQNATVVRLGDVPRTVSHHTLRRGLADAGTSPLHRIVSRASYPHLDGSIQQYLDMLDWVLDDGVIDVREQSEIEALARDLNISEGERMDAHRAYLNCIIAAAERDGVVSSAEHKLIGQLASQLDVHDVAIPERTSVPVAHSISDGSRVCFTGTADKARLEALAKHAGLQPVLNVLKKGCDVLVAADVATSSGKARNAKKWGIPVISAEEFLDRIEGIKRDRGSR